jgi:hypothetical protein
MGIKNHYPSEMEVSLLLIILKWQGILIVLHLKSAMNHFKNNEKCSFLSLAYIDYDFYIYIKDNPEKFQPTIDAIIHNKLIYPRCPYPPRLSRKRDQILGMSMKTREDISGFFSFRERADCNVLSEQL